MRTLEKSEISALLAKKRLSQLSLIFSLIGLISGWLYSPFLWLAILIACCIWVLSAAGLLWLARNPGAHALDFYRSPYWFIKLIDFELPSFKNRRGLE